MTKLEDLIERRGSIALGGGQARIDKQHEQGKMTARERLETLFDPNTFVEIDAFVVHRCYYFGQEKQHFPGDGVVGGYGKVDGRRSPPSWAPAPAAPFIPPPLPISSSR